MKRIAVIPARSGSKRIPGKNTKIFCGKPMLAYSIEAALSSGMFDMVMVSTDSEQTAELAKSFGAEVPFLRSEATSNDYAIDRDVQNEVLSELKKRGLEFDQMVYIYPCAPFVTAKRLCEAVEKLEKTGASMVFPVAQYSDNPIRAYYIDENGFIKAKWPEYSKMRSQDLPVLYHDCGQFYAFNLDMFYDEENYRKSWVPLVIPEEEAQDIDTVDDWKIAEQKYRALHDCEKD